MAPETERQTVHVDMRSHLNWGGSSSAGVQSSVAALEPEGHQFEPCLNPESELAAGDVPVWLEGTAEVPYSKAPNLQYCPNVSDTTSVTQDKFQIDVFACDPILFLLLNEVKIQ